MSCILALGAVCRRHSYSPHSFSPTLAVSDFQKVTEADEFQGLVVGNLKLRPGLRLVVPTDFVKQILQRKLHNVASEGKGDRPRCAFCKFALQHGLHDPRDSDDRLRCVEGDLVGALDLDNLRAKLLCVEDRRSFFLGRHDGRGGTSHVERNEQQQSQNTGKRRRRRPSAASQPAPIYFQTEFLRIYSWAVKLRAALDRFAGCGGPGPCGTGPETAAAEAAADSNRRATTETLLPPSLAVFLSVLLRFVFRRLTAMNRIARNAANIAELAVAPAAAAQSVPPFPPRQRLGLDPPKEAAPQPASASSIPQFSSSDGLPRISVLGIGGAGCNAVENMIRRKLSGVNFFLANTDAQALAHSTCPQRIQLGPKLTSGLGAGARPDVGASAAAESLDRVMSCIRGSHMVFLASGFGGGTGSGATPVIARACRDAGMLTVGVISKPFSFEGKHRMRIAETAMERLEPEVDTLIIVPNQNLLTLAGPKTSFRESFAMADNVLMDGVRGVTDLIVNPGLINLDFADVQTVTRQAGRAMMGTGVASGEHRAARAVAAALENPLLADVTVAGASGVLISISGGRDLTLFEVDEIASKVRDEVKNDEADIIFGSSFDDSLQDSVKVSLIVAGIGRQGSANRQAASASSLSRQPALEKTAAHATASHATGTAAAGNAIGKFFGLRPSATAVSNTAETFSSSNHNHNHNHSNETVPKKTETLSFFKRHW